MNFMIELVKTLVLIQPAPVSYLFKRETATLSGKNTNYTKQPEHIYQKWLFGGRFIFNEYTNIT